MEDYTLSDSELYVMKVIWRSEESLSLQEIAGSVFVIILFILEHTSKWKNSRMRLVWIKIALILYLFPIAAVLVMKSRMGLYSGGIFWISEFWMVSTLPMRKIYILIEAIWLFGLAIGFVFRVIQYCKLNRILKGNIPIEDNHCQKLIDEYKEKNVCKRVKFFRNDLIPFPMTVGSIRPEIILPVTMYTEKELHMVLEHELNHIRSHDLVWKKVALLLFW